MAVKTSIIAAVALLQTVDNSILKMAFPTEYTHDAQKVEFDVYDGGADIALKGSFLQQSNVVSKDGYKTVTVNPMQINESITDAPTNFNKKRIGENVNGDLKGITSQKQMQIEEDMKGFAKLKKRGQRLVKKSAYDVLVSGKVVVSAENGTTDEIDYGLTNKIVNDTSTAGQYEWNDAGNSNPIEQLETESLNMKQYAPNTFVLGFEAHKAFIKHPTVLTSDNTTTGKKANFYLPTVEERKTKSTDTFIFVGTTAGDYGKSLEIYVELDQYNNGSADVFYMNKNYAVGFKRGNGEAGQIQYGNIPVAKENGVNSEIVSFVGEEWIDAEVKKDPAGVKRYFRSSPLPTMNQPKAFISIKATLVA